MKNKLTTDLSTLGFGLMRLPMTEDNWFSGEIFDLLAKSMEIGVNYYDTGYYYLNEKSEELIREALVKRYPRDNFYIADKLPVWDCHSREDMNRIFDIQLERLGTDHIDFYLLHALHKQRWEDIYEVGVLDFIEEKKRTGQIVRAGFSFHDSGLNMRKVVDSYSWDFAQIQLNYYDWTVLHTEDNYRLLEERGIPCITMESVGGGRLSVLPDDAEALFLNIHENKTPSSWAMRFVASLPNVAVILSGMNTEEQLIDNYKSCMNREPLSKEEKTAIERVVDIIKAKEAIPCTACRYCVSECPHKIDIPQVFKAYNDWRIFDEIRYFDIAYNLLAGYPRAEDCIGCSRCKEKCPQNINIPEQMAIIRRVAIEREMGLPNDFFDTVENSKIVCFGCGDYGRRMIGYLRSLKVTNVLYSDNSSDLWGKKFNGYEVISPEEVVNLVQDKSYKIIITSFIHYKEIFNQLLEAGVDRIAILNER